MFKLQKISTVDLIQIIGIILTLLAILISVYHFSKSVSHSILHAKREVTLEQISELPLKVAEFSESSSDVAASIHFGINRMEGIEKDKFEITKKRQDELLIEIKGRIFAYGSEDLIKIFILFEKEAFSLEHEGSSIDTYYLLPLLLAQVKLDVTGEVVSPLIFFNSLMPQFIKHNDSAKDYINKTIDDLKLNNKLKII